METRTLRRNFIQRLFGICITKPPVDPGCWTVRDNKVLVDLGRVPEIAEPNRAVRLEKKGLPYRLLLVHGDNDRYYAFKNRCTHGGRRLDAIPDSKKLQCCSIGRSTYDYSGKVLSGPAKGSIDGCPVRMEDGSIVIDV